MNILWFLVCTVLFSQVLAVCLYPQLLEDKSLPVDVRLRAQSLLEVCPGGSVGEDFCTICLTFKTWQTRIEISQTYRNSTSNDWSTGSYTASSGMPHIRQSIAEFITRRDGGVPSYAKDIIISAGSQRGMMVKLHHYDCLLSRCHTEEIFAGRWMLKDLVMSYSNIVLIFLIREHSDIDATKSEKTRAVRHSDRL